MEESNRAFSMGGIPARGFDPPAEESLELSYERAYQEHMQKVREHYLREIRKRFLLAVRARLLPDPDHVVETGGG